MAKQKYVPIPLDAGDVRVMGITTDCTEECGRTGTHRVVLDMRNAGTWTPITDVMCRTCANRFAKRLKESLPTKAIEEQPIVKIAKRWMRYARGPKETE